MCLTSPLAVVTGGGGAVHSDGPVHVYVPRHPVQQRGIRHGDDRLAALRATVDAGTNCHAEKRTRYGAINASGIVQVLPMHCLVISFYNVTQ